MKRKDTHETRINNYLKANTIAVLICSLILIAGIVFGATYATSLTNDSTRLSDFLDAGFKSLKTDALPNQLSICISYFLDNLMTVVKMLLMTLSVILSPLILYVLFIKGFSISFTVAFLVRDMGISGFATAVTSVLPHNLILLPLYMFAVVSSFSFAATILKKIVTKDKYIDIKKSLKNLFASYVIVIALMIAASLVHAFVSPVLLIFANRFVG